jgi:hypothetical protein
MEDGLDGRRGHAVVGRMLDLSDRQEAEVGKIRQQVKDRDQPRAGCQGQREIAPGVPHLAGSESDVVPGVRGKERADLGDAKSDEQAEHTAGGQDRGDERQVGFDGRNAPRRPKVSEVGPDHVRVAADDQAHHDQREQGKGLGRGENILDEFADLQAARVD